MAKTATFAVVHFSVAFSVAYLLTGSWAISSALALVEPAVNTVAYYFHEKAWNLIDASRAAISGAARPRQTPLRTSPA